MEGGSERTRTDGDKVSSKEKEEANGAGEKGRRQSEESSTGRAKVGKWR
jgi:hypothetical protein